MEHMDAGGAAAQSWLLVISTLCFLLRNSWFLLGTSLFSTAEDVFILPAQPLSLAV